jgi:hypothetical protein
VSKRLGIHLKMTKLVAILLLFVTMSVSACSRSTGPSEGVIASGVTISPGGDSFLIDPPVRSQRASFDIRIKLAADWEIEPPWEKIRIGGEEIRMTAELHAAGGDVFSSVSLGRAAGAEGPYLIFGFPDDLPRGVQFDRVRLVSSSPVECVRVSWHDWDPK